MELTRIKELKARGTLAATVELSGDLYRTIIAELEQAQRGRDAALRRAKVEVWREAATVHRQADGNDCKYCLARAAQIEEGE